MELPQKLDSKFRYILVAAKRARQLQSWREATHSELREEVNQGSPTGSDSGLSPF